MSHDADRRPASVALEQIARQIEAGHQHMRNEFSKIHTRLDDLERRIQLIPLMEFMHRSPLAQQLIEQLRIAEANRPREHEVYPVPQR